MHARDFFIVLAPGKVQARNQDDDPHSEEPRVDSPSNSVDLFTSMSAAM